MDALVRITLRPAGVWTTNWQADTVLGALAAVWARFKGADALRRDLLEPWQAGEPPFVISDALPGDALPAPAALSLRRWPAEQRKAVKQLRWLSPAQFRAAQLGDAIVIDETPADETASGTAFGNAIQTGIQMRNAIDRTDGAADHLFQTAFSYLAGTDATLAIYARTGTEGLAILTEGLHLLGQTGFGANASIGYGGFDLEGEILCPELDNVPDADGFISLSTFQPAPSDPADGFWRMFVKYGKLAPEFQRWHAGAAFKLPQIMLEPGACFRTAAQPLPFYGAAIGPERLFAAAVRRRLAEHGVAPMQPAFALAVPMAWRQENAL